MSEYKGAQVEFYEQEIPKGWDKFEVVLSGKKSEEGLVDETASFFVIAENAMDVHGYAQEVADSMGFVEVGVSSEAEMIKRREEGDTAYQFYFPDPSSAVLLKAPDFRDPIPTAVLVLDSATTKELFDPDAREQRERKKIKDMRAQRRSRASAHSDG